MRLSTKSLKQTGLDKSILPPNNILEKYDQFGQYFEQDVTYTIHSDITKRQDEK